VDREGFDWHKESLRLGKMVDEQDEELFYLKEKLKDASVVIDGVSRLISTYK